MPRGWPWCQPFLARGQPFYSYVLLGFSGPAGVGISHHQCQPFRSSVKLWCMPSMPRSFLYRDTSCVDPWLLGLKYDEIAPHQPKLDPHPFWMQMPFDHPTWQTYSSLNSLTKYLLILQLEKLIPYILHSFFFCSKFWNIL